MSQYSTCKTIKLGDVRLHRIAKSWISSTGRKYETAKDRTLREGCRARATRGRWRAFWDGLSRLENTRVCASCSPGVLDIFQNCIDN